ncbi:MAG TPA: hypothetical protein VLC09_21320 [Polyangiaceae bacterium]|nr:hypothetical protein [Polyangiaceae bacterium]
MSTNSNSSFSGRRESGRLGGGLLATCLAVVLTFAPAQASAVGNEETNAIGKGIVGGALVGGELVMAVEALVGVKPWWGYAIGGGVGAIGGGIGGFFLADAGTGAAPMALLTAGLLLSIPTTVLILDATAYQTEDEPGSDTARTHRQVAQLPPVLAGYDPRVGLTLGVPAVSVGEVYGPRERQAYGLPSIAELRVPVLDLRF